MLWMVLGCTPNLISQDDTGSDESTPETGCEWEAPENTWPSSAPSSCLEGEGLKTGQTAPDIRLLDQNGEEVSLWQFYGDLIFLDFSAEWCAACKVLAEGLDELLEEVEGDGVSAVTVIYNGGGLGAPDQDGLKQWADYSGGVAPVLGDDGTWSDQVITPGSADAYPALLLIDRDMTVLVEEILPVTDQAVLETMREFL